MYEGVITSYNFSRGFGFLLNEATGSLFFHISNCNFDDVDVKSGVKVSFDRVETTTKDGERKFMAINVKLI